MASADTQSRTITRTFVSDLSSLAVPGYLKLDISHFDVGRKIGSGGAATVFESTILSPNVRAKYGIESAAIKIISDGDANNFMFEVAVLG